MRLRQKQSKFGRMIPKLLAYMIREGYEYTFGEAYRRRGVGKRWSLHRKRLAFDINLFKKGRYLTSTRAHRKFGLYWEKLGGTWGGRFGDGNHYSLEHGGVK